jgi:hypothetical protein
VVTHLLLGKYDLGIAAGDVVKKIRLSRDGQLLLVFLENDLDSENGKMLWMPMPDLQGTPLL